jgi:hypothetical protein
VIVDTVSNGAIVPDVDIFDRVLVSTGTRQALEGLKAEGEIDAERLRTVTQGIERQTAGIQIDDVMDRIRRSLEEVRIDSGISTVAYQPDKVMARITEIEKDAGVTEVEPATAAS